jgi:hypothetical protein
MPSEYIANDIDNKNLKIYFNPGMSGQATIFLPLSDFAKLIMLT